MNMEWRELMARIGADSRYRSMFKAAYREGPTPSNLVNAIAVFERSLVTPDCRFDDYLRGKREALSAPEKEGYRLFKAFGCVSCHQGVNIGGNLYQKFGVFKEMLPRKHHSDDPGRFRITRAPRDEHVFRVPSLRNVAITGPYFHDGREPVLEKAVDTMAKAQLGRNLTEDEISKIVGFLKTLTGKYHGRPLTGPAKGVQ
jgi:cytochrome c peroxidase